MNKRILVSISMCLFFLLVSTATAEAQPLRERSRRVMKRTAIVMAIGRQEVKTNQVYTGDLAKAHNHHAYSRWLWRQNDFVRSIYHSRRARVLAAKAIRANYGSVSPEILQVEPIDLPGTVPTDSELDQEMEMNLNMRVYSDEEAIQVVEDEL